MSCGNRFRWRRREKNFEVEKRRSHWVNGAKLQSARGNRGKQICELKLTTRIVHVGRLTSKNNRPCGQGREMKNHKDLGYVRASTTIEPGKYRTIPTNCLELPVLIGQHAYRFP